jgi:WD40-like Beta Propeller Repeat
MKVWVVAASVFLLAAPMTANVQPSGNPTPRDALRSAFGGTALDAIGRFDYRLTVESAEGQVQRDARYALTPASGRLYVRDLIAAGESQIWSAPDGTWQRVDGQIQFLGSALAQPYRGHVASHFLSLFASPRTRYERTAADRIRIAPADAEAFEVVIDPKSGHILENRFASGATGRELDYRQFDGVWWPMQYEIVIDGRKVRHGRFSDVEVVADSGLPPLDAALAERYLPVAQAGLARLIGAGWLSTPQNEYNLSMNAAQSAIVFARSEADFKNAHIWIARRDGQRWSEPAQASFSDPRYSDSDPWLAPNGKMLYFISNRPIRGEEPRKNLDIWRVPLDEGGFGIPEHLRALNSEAQELGPEVHDGWLYFNSSRQGGPARLSIYRARLNGTSFDAPEPLPPPFNDGTAQGDFTLSPDGTLAMFWSERDGAQDADLFAVRRNGSGWSKPVRLPAPLNAAGFDFTPSFSPDGRELRFASMRKPAWLQASGHVLNGLSNLYVAPSALIEVATLESK